MQPYRKCLCVSLSWLSFSWTTELFLFPVVEAIYSHFSFNKSPITFANLHIYLIYLHPSIFHHLYEWGHSSIRPTSIIPLPCPSALLGDPGGSPDYMGCIIPPLDGGILIRECEGGAVLLWAPSGCLNSSSWLYGWLIFATWIRILIQSHSQRSWLYRWTLEWWTESFTFWLRLHLHNNGPVQRPHYCWRCTSSFVFISHLIVVEKKQMLQLKCLSDLRTASEIGEPASINFCNNYRTF